MPDETVITLVLAILGLTGGVIARDRQLSRMITEGDQGVRRELEDKINLCHTRINGTRDEFVRREDLDGHLARIERSIASVHVEIKGTNARIDNFITAIAHDKHN